MAQHAAQHVTLGGSGLHPLTRIVLMSPFDLWRYLTETHYHVTKLWRTWAESASQTGPPSSRRELLLEQAGPHSLEQWRTLLNEDEDASALRSLYARRQTLLRKWYRTADGARPDDHFDTLVIRTIESKLNYLRGVVRQRPDLRRPVPSVPQSVAAFSYFVKQFVEASLRECAPPWNGDWDPLSEHPAYHGPNSERWQKWERSLGGLQKLDETFISTSPQ